MDAAINKPDTCPELPKPRSFWQRIGDRLAAIIGTRRAATPPEKSVAFTIAVISLGAKLAKADGAPARALPEPDRRLDAGVPGRKRAQIEAFAAHLPAAGLPLLEWCAGKGHLGRRLGVALHVKHGARPHGQAHGGKHQHGQRGMRPTAQAGWHHGVHP